MKVPFLLFILITTFSFAQKETKVDSINYTYETQYDDYKQKYVYAPNDQSLKKYDSLGKPLAQLMLSRPYKIQAITNPLNIVLFSVNTQEIKLIDQNLNDIQTINLSNNFGFVTAAYVEDLQVAWIIDNSNKSLNQYQYRNNKLINSTPFHINTEDIIDFLVHKNLVYILKNNSFNIYNLQGQILETKAVDSPIRLKRNYEEINIITKSKIIKYNYPK